METLTAFDLARRRMARLDSGSTGVTALFGHPGSGAAPIDGEHTFCAELVTVEAGAVVTLAAAPTDHVLFGLDGLGHVRQGGESTTCSRWDLVALAADAAVEVSAASAPARFLHLVPDPATYREADRRPSVTGPFDAGRVARWGQVKGIDDAFVTSSTPGLEKRVFKLLNRGISTGAHIVPAVPHEYPFAMSIVEMEAGKGAALHSHATEEIFVALDGDLDLFWGDRGEGRLRLAQGQTVSMPTGLMRGFRNENGRQFHMLAIVGGWNRQSVTSVNYQSDGFQPMPAAPAVAA